MTDDEIWEIERKLWLADPEIYERAMDPECIMVFPQVGIMKSTDVIEGLKSGSRWDDVRMSRQVVSRAGDGMIVLAYLAEGSREGEAPYNCYCTSTYRSSAVGWLLVQHQQTPATHR